MKLFSSLLFFIAFSVVSGYTQNASDLYKDYSARIPGFSWNETEVIKDEGLSEVEARNKKGDVLRFKVDKNDGLSAYHCGISYIHYAFTDGWITSITTYDREGNIKGDTEFKDIAIVRFEILQPDLLKIQMVTIDEADGNISMKDADKRMVIKRIYTPAMELLVEKYISSDEYWKMQLLVYRP